MVVRRPGPDGPELLLLHRAAEGVAYEGDWAWTSPAGCRQPGEPVDVAARRELAEEAGITEGSPRAVDLSSGWVTYLLDVPVDQPVTLVDPEHDRYAWCSLPEAAVRVLPEHVALQQVARISTLPCVALAFRPLESVDVDDVVRWHRAPHVARWFRDPPDAVRAKYAARAAGDDPVAVHVVEVDGHAGGLVQSHRCDEPTAAGIDLLVGDPALVGLGLGTMIIYDYLRDVLRRLHPEVTTVTADPDVRNPGSRRALAKAGFRSDPERPEPDDGPVELRFDLVHVFGPTRAAAH